MDRTTILARSRNSINATINVLNIGIERLMSVESFGNRSLRQSRQLSLLGQQLSKSPMAIRMHGFGHPLAEQISLRRCVSMPSRRYA
ncbi:hypothetical protein [Mesorhizobium sp. B2-6-5]|uniref:hypothetical protein n=1 Tax=Mesorhizobium sp. B2-6-5 TaxID=2589912 RepID=UPI0015E3EA99|nr:hypothetical protein [Mesorhizobium sp. B2-6-5]